MYVYYYDDLIIFWLSGIQNKNIKIVGFVLMEYLKGPIHRDNLFSYFKS